MEKRILFILIIGLVIINIPGLIFSQNEEIQGKLTFLDIPVNNTLKEFTSSMRKKGFTYENESNIAALMKGKFVNKNCLVYISSVPETNRIEKVGVIFPLHEKWYGLKKEYLSIKKKFVSDFGEASSEKEIFEDPYEEGDKKEMKALNEKKCEYKCVWEKLDGSINLTIVESGRVFVVFVPKNREKE